MARPVHQTENKGDKEPTVALQLQSAMLQSLACKCSCDTCLRSLASPFPLQPSLVPGTVRLVQWATRTILE